MFKVRDMKKGGGWSGREKWTGHVALSPPKVLDSLSAHSSSLSPRAVEGSQSSSCFNPCPIIASLAGSLLSPT